jgi:hypothetical protein
VMLKSIHRAQVWDRGLKATESMHFVMEPPASPPPPPLPRQRHPCTHQEKVELVTSSKAEASRGCWRTPFNSQARSAVGNITPNPDWKIYALSKVFVKLWRPSQKKVV